MCHRITEVVRLRVVEEAAAADACTIRNPSSIILIPSTLGKLLSQSLNELADIASSHGGRAPTATLR